MPILRDFLNKVQESKNILKTRAFSNYSSKTLAPSLEICPTGMLTPKGTAQLINIGRFLKGCFHPQIYTNISFFKIYLHFYFNREVPASYFFGQHPHNNHPLHQNFSNCSFLPLWLPTSLQPFCSAFQDAEKAHILFTILPSQMWVHCHLGHWQCPLLHIHAVVAGRDQTKGVVYVHIWCLQATSNSFSHLWLPPCPQMPQHLCRRRLPLEEHLHTRQHTRQENGAFPPLQRTQQTQDTASLSWNC